jgi:hypothetical protein
MCAKALLPILAAIAAALCPHPVAARLSFADGRAERAFRGYVAFLERDQHGFAGALDTIRRLAASDVEFRVAVGAGAPGEAHGSISTDGERVHVTIGPTGGPCGEPVSINARFAHELEHARQFEDGELAFARGACGRWFADSASYDIGDEVKAWAAQLAASSESDMWARRGGRRAPSLLRRFADARDDRDRARVLLATTGYARLGPDLHRDVVVADPAAAPGRLLRTKYFFGRVRARF